MNNGIVTSAVSVEETINIPAGPAWEILSAFKDIEEFSPITKSKTKGEGVGAERTCVLPDGSVVKELLINLDHTIMKMVYVIIEATLPVKNYTASVQVVHESPESCEIQYSATYQVAYEHQEEIMKLIRDFYAQVIYGLERYIKVA